MPGSPCSISTPSSMLRLHGNGERHDHEHHGFFVEGMGGSGGQGLIALVAIHGDVPGVLTSPWRPASFMRKVCWFGSDHRW